MFLRNRSRYRIGREATADNGLKLKGKSVQLLQELYDSTAACFSYIKISDGNLLKPFVRLHRKVATAG